MHTVRDHSGGSLLPVTIGFTNKHLDYSYIPQHARCTSAAYYTSVPLPLLLDLGAHSSLSAFWMGKVPNLRLSMICRFVAAL